MLTADEIRPHFGQAEDAEVAAALEAHVDRLRKARQPLYFVADDLDRVLHWKLRGQYGRQARARRVNSDEVIRIVTTAAFLLTHDDHDYEMELKVTTLCSLRGVGVPVASAILAIVHPDRYGVIDVRVWRQLFGGEKTVFTLGDYRRYLAELRRLAAELGWRARDVDEAIWGLDRRRTR